MAQSARRQEILQVAARLFAQRGVPATSMRDIGNEVGILSGSLYHHLSSKDDVVTELILEWLDDLLARYDAVDAPQLPPREALHALIEVSLGCIEDYPHAIMIYQNDRPYLRDLPAGDQIDKATSNVPELWLSVIERGVADGDFRDDVPPRVFYNMLRDALWGSVTWFDPDASRSSAQMASDVATVFLDGFTAA